MNKVIIPTMVVLVLLLVPSMVNATSGSYRFPPTNIWSDLVRINANFGSDECITPLVGEFDLSQYEKWRVESWNSISEPPYVNCRILDSTDTWVKWSCDIDGYVQCGSSTNFFIGTFIDIRFTLKECGDGRCGFYENEINCPIDCDVTSPPEPFCGDLICQQGETYFNCPEDCAFTGYCGDDNCDLGETEETCPEDCLIEPICGNLVCDDGESNDNCPSDCPQEDFCGDEVCNEGEDVVNCRSDCYIIVCGDDLCEGDENDINCPDDCLVEEPPEEPPEEIPEKGFWERFISMLQELLNNFIIWLHNLLGGS